MDHDREALRGVQEQLEQIYQDMEELNWEKEGFLKSAQEKVSAAASDIYRFRMEVGAI